MTTVEYTVIPPIPSNPRAINVPKVYTSENKADESELPEYEARIDELTNKINRSLTNTVPKENQAIHEPILSLISLDDEPCFSTRPVSLIRFLYRP